jgi:hypothetical protein
MMMMFKGFMAPFVYKTGRLKDWLPEGEKKLVFNFFSQVISGHFPISEKI